MECMNTIFPFILYLLGAALLVVLIIICIKILGTLKRVDRILDDVEVKASKVDGVFDLVANATDTLSIVSSKVFDFFIGLITGWMSKKEKGNEKNE